MRSWISACFIRSRFLAFWSPFVNKDWEPGLGWNKSLRSEEFSGLFFSARLIEARHAVNQTHIQTWWGPICVCACSSSPKCSNMYTTIIIIVFGCFFTLKLHLRSIFLPVQRERIVLCNFSLKLYKRLGTKLFKLWTAHALHKSSVIGSTEAKAWVGESLNVNSSARGQSMHENSRLFSNSEGPWHRLVSCRCVSLVGLDNLEARFCGHKSPWLSGMVGKGRFVAFSCNYFKMINEI